jgi:hypothetical protein
VSTDLAEVLAAINEQFVGRQVGDEGHATAEILAVCRSHGVRATEVEWSDGEWGRRAAVRIEPEVGEITINAGPRP